jgi:hypothetical protein
MMIFCKELMIMYLARLAMLPVAALVLSAPLASAQSLDFETYRTKVEPIFLKKRAPHARCVVCHSNSNSAFRLEALPKGVKEYTPEQSRKNFANVSNLVKPGNPDGSRLLIHPLTREAGGDLFHNGGRQFASRTDPDWLAIADWVKKGK